MPPGGIDWKVREHFCNPTLFTHFIILQCKTLTVSDMQSMLSSWRAARYPQLKHKLTIWVAALACSKIGRVWKSVLYLSALTRGVWALQRRRSGEWTYNGFEKTKKAMQSMPQAAIQRSKRRLEKNIKATHNNTTQFLDQRIYHKIISGIWT